MPDSFGRTLTIGVEEELMLLDPETFALAPGVERILGLDGLKTELFSCLVETNTPVCATAAEARAEILRLRALAREAAERASLVVAASGSHPFSRPEEQAIVAEPRYVKLLAKMGPGARRQLVCGLHVHVGMESWDACLRTLRGVLPWLPSLLALSANSPFLSGEETGALSARAARLLELPRAGPPPRLADRAAWEQAIGATGQDYTRTWWDARPHPRLGTLEVRIADQPTSAERTAALVAIVQALCAQPPPVEPLKREDYLAQRAAAARGELDGLPLLGLVEPAARKLGSWELVQELRRPPEALRQLDTGRNRGLREAAAELAELSR